MSENKNLVVQDQIVQGVDVRIGFNTSDTWIGKLIRWATKGKVSHAYLSYTEVTTGQRMVIEAAWNGFVCHTHEAATAGTRIVAEVPLKGEYLETKVLYFAMQWLGKKYDYKGLLGSAWVQVGRWAKKKWSNPLQDSNDLFCSEAIARALRLARYMDADKLGDPAQVSPQDLYDWCVKTDHKMDDKWPR